jgi:diaminopimelate epimerase
MSAEFSRFPLFKLVATGNDFILADLLDPAARPVWEAEFSRRARPQLAAKWCDRHTGLGADGFVILESSKAADFKWDFYNSDGGGAELCGNAARAVSLYAHLLHGRKEWAFETRAGLVKSWVHSPDDVEVQLPAVSEALWDEDSGGIRYALVRAGVPHAVVPAPRLEPLEPLRALALNLKRDPRFANEGVNVTFVQANSPAKIQAVTFERGVEDFTLSCGTGAVAAAYSILKGAENTPVEVQVPGGRLTVVWKEGRPHLHGPAQVSARIQVALK